MEKDEKRAPLVRHETSRLEKETRKRNKNKTLTTLSLVLLLCSTVALPIGRSFSFLILQNLEQA